VFLDRQINDVPPGIKQDVALFVSLISDPEIIFLDEPTSGVAPDARRSFWVEIYNLKKMGKTLLVSTHNLDEVAYVDRVLMIHHGRKLVEGAPDDLLREYNKESIELLFKDLISENEKT
jgi:ABC-2 type transport system ATP-binding protein